MKKSKFLKRYSVIERVNHWVVVWCFLLLAISGLAFFYPAFFWLTGIFGTPQLARILHPFIGIVMFISFLPMFWRYWHHNLLNKEDIKWMKSVKTVLQGHEVGDTGKYNAGQKGMFWLMTACMLMLLTTGLISWRAYFSAFFPIWVLRLALMLHAGSAIALIAGIIVHVYAAFWVKGTFMAMIEGKVFKIWAEKHHPKWYREEIAAENEAAAKDMATNAAAPTDHNNGS